MMQYLSHEDLLRIAERALTQQILVRDYGLLEAALARPRATVLGTDAYQTVWRKAAALLQSLACNHALVDGNKRLAFHATVVFLWLNGQDVIVLDDDLFDLVVSVADGSLSDVAKLGERLESFTRPR